MMQKVIYELLAEPKFCQLIDPEEGVADGVGRLEAVVHDLQEALHHEAVLGQIALLPRVEEGDHLADQHVLPRRYVLPADVEGEAHELGGFGVRVRGARADGLEGLVELDGQLEVQVGEEVDDVPEEVAPLLLLLPLLPNDLHVLHADRLPQRLQRLHKPNLGALHNRSLRSSIDQR